MSPLGLSPSEPPGTGGAYLTVADMLGRGVAVEWYEAVALVRAVAELSVGNGRIIPELNQIRLDSFGVVDVVGAIAVDEPVRRLGQLLQALIAQADAPVQLRLMITQATAPAPLFASIQEYSEALGYFERPNRTAVLRTLYERAAAAQPLVDNGDVPKLDDVAPLPEASPVRPERKRNRDPLRARRMLTAAAALAIVASAAAGGLWLLRRQHVNTPSGSQVTEIADQASEKLGNAVVSGVSAVTEKLGLGRIVPAAAPAAPPPPPAAASSPEPKAERHARRKADHTVGSRVMPGMAFDLAGATGMTGAGKDIIYDGVVTDGDGEEHAADTSMVYGPGSEGVVPPVAVEPPLPRMLPPDLDAHQLGKMELVIAVDGSVESVKLVGPPRNVHDAMFLSVAKAWQFQPALKDGVPVRYRKIIWIASQ